MKTAYILKKGNTFAISVPVQMIKEGKAFVAFCPVLDLSTQGNSFGQAQKMFDEIVRIFIEEIDRMGTMDKVLNDLGWRKNTSREWVPPERHFLGESTSHINVCPT